MINNIYRKLIFWIILILISGMHRFAFGQAHRIDIGVGSLQISLNTAFADGSQRLRYPREYSVYKTRYWDDTCVKGGGVIVAAKNFQSKAAYHPEGIPVGGQPDNGWTIADKLFPYYVLDATSKFAYDTKHSTVPVIDKHRKYWKYYRPTRIVNGLNIPGGAWTNYDVLDENIVTEQMGVSVCNTSMGLTITERAYVFGNPDYDDFAIVEYVFKNTGETGSTYSDGSPITYSTNTISDCYVGVKFWPVISERNVAPNSNGWKEGTDDWVEYTHEVDGENLRVMYGWDGNSEHQSEDDEGDPLIFTSGIFLSHYYPGMAVLHVDNAPDDPSNDPDQPNFSYASFGGYQSNNTLTMGRSYSMEQMYAIIDTGNQLIPALDWDLWKNSQTESWLRGTSIATEQFNQIGTLAFGPYQFDNIGDSIRVVLCFAVGSIGWDKSIELGAQWHKNEISKTEKNVILRSSRDSLFAKIKAVKELFKKGDGSYDYTIQTIAGKIQSPPAWPDTLAIKAVIGGCRVHWAPVDNAVAYRVYRRSQTEFLPETPSNDAPYPLVYQCGGDNPGGDVIYNVTIDSTTWVDTGTIPGHRYWYSVTALNANGIESSQFILRTTPTAGDVNYGSVAPFEKPPTDLNSVNVVPNPYHVKAYQYYNRNENILDFVGLPAGCRIRIYTQSGNLVKTITHKWQDPPSSSENWEMRTEMNQTIASGLYVYVVDECIDHSKKAINETKVGKFVVIR